MIEEINLSNIERWDEIVHSFKEYDVYYLSGYVRGFQLHGDGEPILIYYINKDSDSFFQAMNVVMKRNINEDLNIDKIDNETYFDLCSPYGYGGFILEGEISEKNIEKLNNEYFTYCKTNNIITEFVRFHPIVKNHKNLNHFYDVKYIGKTINISLYSKNVIWENFTSNNRNMIRKAIKNNVKIYWGRNKRIFSEFVPMYHSTMNRDDAKDYYYFCEDFYKSILNDLKYNSLIFYALYDDKIISAAIILFANKKIHYHLSATNRDYQSLAATNLLLYEVANWGIENGYESFHLGGGVGGKEDGLYRFKKNFNKNSTAEFYVGKKIYDFSKYDNLVKINGKTNENNSFFPIYRLK